jgi:enoyl-CoA hydratase/carnithine racemase
MAEPETLMMDPQLLVETRGSVVHLILNRPKKRNALSRGLLSNLQATLNSLAAKPEARVIVLTGRGPVFSSGHDMKEMLGGQEKEYTELFSLCSRVMMQLRSMPQPVIARVQGMATAAGCQLVAACDLAVAVESATFATPGVKVGLFCTTPMVPLVRAIPEKAAMEMLMLGQPITAARALELGLVNRVVPDAKLDEAVDELVQGLLATSPAVLRLGKAAFYDTLSLSELDAYERAVKVMTTNILRRETQEGMRAFLDRRTPQ